LNKPEDSNSVRQALKKIKGVETVLTRNEAARLYHLKPERIGDLVVLGDRNTVFGDLDAARESLPKEYRTHGSIYELEVPLFIYNYKNTPNKNSLQFNYQVASWLFK
jgi:phosphonoacetate hydrolase